ncbi:hypothetical protein ACFW4O_35515 [Streptomyces mutabilis]|uniref:hypothetical protein n=1 Tax=Streptomyces TaxID=1883 RepID=UPI0025B40918|nr:MULTISPECIES: hypothetical protein [unclassified Streptomyces]MDN3250414.1 hypothetical protein [Streptomyces sp. ZSW22]MDN3254380.1 hypothetical protein [Streptomyces sp. MA25(2023)]
MNGTDRAAAPIYEQLIAERGDAVAVAAHTAEQTQREAAEALDFSTLGTGSGTLGAPGHEDSEE